MGDYQQKNSNCNNSTHILEILGYPDLWGKTTPFFFLIPWKQRDYSLFEVFFTILTILFFVWYLIQTIWVYDTIFTSKQFFYICFYIALDYKTGVQDVVNSFRNPQTLTCPEAALLVPALTPTHVQSPAAFGGIFSFLPCFNCLWHTVGLLFLILFDLLVSRYMQKFLILPLGVLHNEMGKSRSRQAHRISFL